MSDVGLLDPPVGHAISRAVEAREALAAAGPEGVAAALGRACDRIARGDDDLRDDLSLLAPSTGLSGPMVRWALETTLGGATEDAWLALARAHLRPPPGRDARPQPARLVAVWLAGNVFTAAVRGMFLPLLAGAPVVAKASSRESIFPRLLARTLAEESPAIGRALAVVGFAGDDAAAGDALLAAADVVSVYGADGTVAALRGRVPATSRVVPHGHGLGAAYVPAAALDGERAAERVARALALDVAAYDQRGCLSPHAVFVEEGGAVPPAELARLLADVGLAELAASLPRGPLPADVGGAQLQWRGVAAVRGALFEGDGYAASFEDRAPLRVSPGWRNVAVLACDGPEDAVARLAPAGSHLKSLGVAGDAAAGRRLAALLRTPLAPTLAPVGQMQTPPLDVLADGAPPLEGLFRWIDVGPADDAGP